MSEGGGGCHGAMIPSCWGPAEPYCAASPGDRLFRGRNRNIICAHTSLPANQGDAACEGRVGILNREHEVAVYAG